MDVRNVIFCIGLCIKTDQISQTAWQLLNVHDSSNHWNDANGYNEAQSTLNVFP